VHVIHWIAMKAKGNEQSIVNGARRKWCKTEKKESEPCRVSNPGRWIRSRRVLSHYTTNASWEIWMMRYMLYRSDVQYMYM
jgi:hypothetical protein